MDQSLENNGTDMDPAAVAVAVLVSDFFLLSVLLSRFTLVACLQFCSTEHTVLYLQSDLLCN